MADDLGYTPGAGATIATDDIGGRHFQRVKPTLGADGTAVDVSAGAGAVGTGVQRVTLANDDPAVASLALLDDVIFVDDAAYTPGTSKLLVFGAQADMTSPDSVDEGDAGALRMTLSRELLVSPLGFQVTCSTQVTRPANTTTYAVDDALADATPTAGGFTFTGAARKSGGSGYITDLIVAFDEDAAVPLQGELCIFDQAVTAITDNAAFAVTDAEARTCVARIPFSLTDFGNNGLAHIQNLAIGFTCSGSTNLRFLVRVKNAYVPTTNSSVITFVVKILQTD